MITWANLLHTIRGRQKEKDTLTIIVADHGDGLGDHGYMGHAFVAYEELVHVPLILDWPAVLPAASRVSTPVSTRRVFHTMVESVPEWPADVEKKIVNEARLLSLRHTAVGKDTEENAAMSEVYPPLNFVKAIERRQPELLDEFNCLDERHALVKQVANSTFKLIQLDHEPDELFDLPADACELQNIIEQNRDLSRMLNLQLSEKSEKARKMGNREPDASVDFDADTQLRQRLKGLGYLD